MFLFYSTKGSKCISSSLCSGIFLALRLVKCCKNNSTFYNTQTYRPAAYKMTLAYVFVRACNCHLHHRFHYRPYCPSCPNLQLHLLILYLPSYHVHPFHSPLVHYSSCLWLPPLLSYLLLCLFLLRSTVQECRQRLHRSTSPWRQEKGRIFQRSLASGKQLTG